MLHYHDTLSEGGCDESRHFVSALRFIKKAMLCTKCRDRTCSVYFGLWFSRFKRLRIESAIVLNQVFREATTQACAVYLLSTV